MELHEIKTVGIGGLVHEIKAVGLCGLEPKWMEIEVLNLQRI